MKKSGCVKDALDLMAAEPNKMKLNCSKHANAVDDTRTEY